jgi:hypothetical protein
MSLKDEIITALGIVALSVLAITILVRGPSSVVNAQVPQQTNIPCYINQGVGTTAAVASGLCRNTEAVIKGIRFVNISAMPAFLRLYNTSSTPICSSATGFVESIPIPPNYSGIVDLVTNFRYSQGVGYCVTGGGANNNNTAPPAGVYGVIAIGG